MGFEDLERKLQKFFTKEAQLVDPVRKAQTKEQILAEYSAKKGNSWETLWETFLNYRYSNVVISATVVALLMGFVPFLNNQLYAGEISSSSGLVKIIRDGKRVIINGKSKIKIGDEIIVSNNANAKLSLRRNFESEISENSRVKVTGKDNLFLIRGQLNNNFESGKISTNKGEILAKSPSNFLVDVSNSGETKILPLQNPVLVRNWQGEEIELIAGEELRLRSDTNLVRKIVPDDLKLSITQITAIKSKLFIARTKALNYVENSMIKEYKKASADLISAEKTFKSIAQVLKSSRDLQVLLPRENINMLEISDVYDRLSRKIEDRDLLSEVKAVEVLLELINDKKTFNFPVPQTDILSFNRYVLVSRIFSLESREKQELGNILRQQYVVLFAKKIFNEEFRIDQISVLNKEVKKLPKTTLSKFFLNQVKDLLTPEIRDLLEEKMSKNS